MTLTACAPTASARPQACQQVRPTAAAAATKAWQHAAARPAARRPRLQQQLCRAAAEAAQQPEAAAAQGAGAKASAAPNKPKLMSAAWEQAVAWQKESAELEGTIAEANRSGLKIPLPNKLTGFLPYKLLDPARLDGVDRSGPGAPAAMKALVGSKLRFKVTQVIVPEKRLILSEKAVLLGQLAACAAQGDVVEGRVGAIMDWGAFVECLTVNGQPCPRAEAVLPLRELSYSWVGSPGEVLKSGQAVRAAVMYVSQEPPKVVVSLKRLEDDPLKETLDNVLPLNDPESSYAAVDAVPAAVPQGVDEILEALSREPAVQAVSLGRCVEEKRTVSQDLELWITKDKLDDGFNLAVRAGRLVQEVHVATRMSADEMRATVQRVLRSIN